MVLTDLEEDLLIKFIDRIDSKGFCGIVLIEKMRNYVDEWKIEAEEIDDDDER